MCQRVKAVGEKYLDCVDNLSIDMDIVKDFSFSEQFHDYSLKCLFIF